MSRKCIDKDVEDILSELKEVGYVYNDDGKEKSYQKKNYAPNLQLER